MSIQHIGKLVSLVGSFCGLFLLYIIPISVHLKSEYIKLNYPALVNDLDNDKIDTLEEIKGSKWKSYQ